MAELGELKTWGAVVIVSLDESEPNKQREAAIRVRVDGILTTAIDNFYHPISGVEVTMSRSCFEQHDGTTMPHVHMEGRAEFIYLGDKGLKSMFAGMLRETKPGLWEPHMVGAFTINGEVSSND